MKFGLPLRVRAFTCLATSFITIGTAQAAPEPGAEARVNAAAKALAAELAGACPLSDPASSSALASCRQGLYHDSELRRALAAYVLWGRQRDPRMLLKDTKLTQFGPDVLTGMYLPLFMFNGKYSVTYVDSEGGYLIRLQTAFRNRLTPGEYPYPFWHEDEKWSMYEKANEVLLWWDSKAGRIKVAQFTMFGTNPPIHPTQHMARPQFDGRWLWTDSSGRTQPKVTVFDGIFKADNPYIDKLDTAYKAFALRLRDGQCDQCHVPSNPDGMKKLVLLQSPMHAAAEIKRVLKAVREDRMPRDEFGIEQPLDAASKAALLNEGVAFEKMLDAAKSWESSRSVASDARRPAE
jgi:hypothetical protein